MTFVLRTVEPHAAWRASGWAAALGVVAFAVGLAAGRGAVAFAALTASWLFFAGLAAGSLALLAAVRIAEGQWARPVLPIAEACAAFLGPSLALQAVLVAGACFLLPAHLDTGLGHLTFRVLRQIVPTIALCVLGQRLAAASAQDTARSESLTLAVGYVATYVVALSLWASDWVLSLSSAPPAAVVPAYYFMGAFLSGLAWTALVAALRDVSGADLRHDLGKLLFAFVVVWAYLLWALFLAAWYGHVPAEVEPLLRRWSSGYRPATIAVIASVFVWPFWLLFSERTKRLRGTLALGAALTLLGMWAERFLLVLPSLDLDADPVALLVGAGVALGVAGLFLHRVGPQLTTLDARPVHLMQGELMP